jgi:cobalt-zinc-cadmium efflux system outer membrane protein
MKHRWLVLFVVLLNFQPGSLLAAEEAGPNSLRLDSRYLHWTPSAPGGAYGANALAQPESLFQPGPASSSPHGMTLTDLEALAEHNNPTLAQAAARVEAARAECVQAGLYPNPRIGYHATEIGDEGQGGQQGAFISQEFVTANKLQRGRDVANQSVEQALWACQAQRDRVLGDVRRAFYDVLVAQQTVALTDQLVRVGEEGVRAAEALFGAKEVSRVDVLQARIEADSARILADKARNRHSAAWRNLAVVAGAADMQPTPLVGELQDGLLQLTWEDALSRVLGTSPALEESRAGIARAEAVLSRECAGRVPNVEMLAGVAYDNATRDTIAEVQVGLPLPVFNRNQGNIRKAQAELAVARSEAHRTALELQQRLATVFEQYQNARCQVEKYAHEILPNAQTSLDLVTAGYRQGEFNYLTLLTAQRTFFQANLAYVDAVRDLRWATVAIEVNLLGDSLQQR